MPNPYGDGGTADPSFEQFYAAIASQESGGNYGAVNNQTGALGKYQILPGNIGPWSQQYLGQSITPQQFLANPALQERLAHAVLYNYYSQWGARGAASAWYSGSPTKWQDSSPQGGYPSVAEYVNSVIDKALHINQADAAAQAGKYATTGSVTTTTTDNTTQATPVDKLGPQDDKAGPLGMAGMIAPGAGAANAPGSAAVDQMTPGVMGADRQQILDALDNSTEQTPQQNPGPQTTVTPTQFQNISSAGRQSFISAAMQALGTPYVWGGAGPGGFDCSGLIQWAAKQAGYSVPRLAANQMQVGGHVGWDQLQPGDFIGWDENPNDYNGTGADHIAIYIGNNQILEAPHTGLDVRVRDLSNADMASGWAIDTSGIFNH